MTSTRATATDYNMTAGSSSSGNKFTNIKTETDTPLPPHGMNVDQLSKLNDAVQELETHLLHCVDDVRQHRWPARSPLKTEAELRLRELLVRRLILNLFSSINQPLFL